MAVFPREDTYTPLWRQLAGGRRCITFGEGGDVQVHARLFGSEGAWSVAMATPRVLRAAVCTLQAAITCVNALAAAACALAAGAPLDAVVQGLEAFVPVKGRSRALQISHGGRGITVVDDSYNANPDSVRAAIDVLADLPAPQLLVMGDMGEVGDAGPRVPCRSR